jgi:hypothetical protein
LPWRGNNLDAGGLLAMLCGAIGISVSIFVFIGWHRYGLFAQMMGVIVLGVAIITIWGTRRYVFPAKNYWLSIFFGGVCAIACGMFFGVIALFLIVISKKEF